MNSFPAFFPLTGRTVVIAGSGEAAEAKARLFDGSPARVVRLEGEAAGEPDRYRGAALAFIAGGDATFLASARDAARAAAVPVNVTDHPELCDFTTPAVIDRGEVVAAVGTDGGAPMLAALLRNDIEARVPAGAGRLAAFLRAAQAEVRAALPDLAARRSFLRGVLAGPIAEAAMAGDAAGARSLLRAALAGEAAGRRSGRVCLVAPATSPDLISLRAARRLAQADILVLGSAADPAVVDLGRRDARRLRLGEADLAALAAESLVVVIASPDEPALDALRAAGVTVEILASAKAPV